MMDLPNTLLKFLTRYAGLSRRAAEPAIRAGRVTVNGQVQTRPETRLSADDQIALDHKSIVPETVRHCYLMLNKPVGYTVSAADAHAEHLAQELLGETPLRLFPAGRLDRDSEGLLLFSSDGDWINRASHPRYHIEKEYRVELDRELPEPAEKAMQSGLLDAGELLKAECFTRLPSGAYRVILHEGRKREIRRLARHFGARVTRLQRVRQGEIELGNLPTGQYRELTALEIASVYAKNGASL